MFEALNDVASQFKKGMKVEDMANELDITTNKALLQMNLPPNHVVVQHIVGNKSINADKILLLGLSEDQVQELVQRNILAQHPNGTLTFHDRHVEMWFQRTLV